MTIDEAIQHCEEVARNNDITMRRCDDASGYTRSGREEIRTSEAKKCEQCAADHRQLVEWLKDYKRLLEQDSCSDAISRQAVIDVINLGWDYRRNCIRAIEKLPPVKQEQSSSENPNKWIPVSERLPKEDTNVLCWYEYFRYGNYNKMYQTYGVGTYFGRFGWAGDITGDQARVIAWMPLPKPYEPQESEIRNDNK